MWNENIIISVYYYSYSVTLRKEYFSAEGLEKPQAGLILVFLAKRLVKQTFRWIMSNGINHFAAVRYATTISQVLGMSRV
jgi:hypothetical protein